MEALDELIQRYREYGLEIELIKLSPAYAFMLFEEGLKAFGKSPARTITTNSEGLYMGIPFVVDANTEGFKLIPA